MIVGDVKILGGTAQVGKPLSEKSVESIHNTLCSILSDAVGEGIPTQPARAIR